MNQPLYTIEILRLAASIPHLGRLEDAQGTAQARSPTCGSVVTAYVNLDQEGRVSDFAQEVEACAFGQASAALVGSRAVGRNARETEQALAEFSCWLRGDRDDPGDWPALEALGPARSRATRHGAMLLPLKALLAAIRDASDNRA